MAWLKHSLLIALSTMLFACGGDGSVDLSGGGNGGDGDNSEPNSAILSVALYSCSNWDKVDINQCEGETTSISYSNPGVIYIVATTETGQPASNQIVSVSSTIGTILGNGSALTNANGVAIFDITTDISTSGAGTINANFDGVKASTNFQVGATDINIAISSSVADGESLANGSSAIISVQLTTEDGSPYTSPFETTFTSGCVSTGKATIDESVSTNDGTAFATYMPSNCRDIDTISATTNVSNLSATTNISISSTSANSIEFTSATPEYIVLKGSGGQESATLVFKVVDDQNNGVAQQEVNFELSSDLPGVSLSTDKNTTGNDGNVSVVINSGNVHGTVAVIASFTDPNKANAIISTVSSNLVVSTGLPDNASFTFSASKYNPEGWDYTAEEVTFTVSASDHFNHPVPNGTEIGVRTTGGTIKDSSDLKGSCTTLNGHCEITLITTNPKPSSGRFKVTAFVVGEEYFTDLNGNGVYDSSDHFPLVLDDRESTPNDLAEIFIDVSDTGSYSPTQDEFIDYNNNGVRDPSNSIYNGSLCSDAALAANHCTRELLYLGKELTLVMSGSDTVFSVYNETGGVQLNSGDTIDVSAAPVELTVTVSDTNGNSLPGETTINASTDNGEIKQGDSKTIGSNLIGPYSYTILVAADDTAEELDFLTITSKTPKDNTNEFILQVQD